MSMTFSITAASVWLLGASPIDAPTPLMSRAEPNLDVGRALLDAGDVDGALERFRQATPKSADERAVVEYDVGAALLQRARAAAQSARGQPPFGANAAGAHAPGAPPAPPSDDEGEDPSAAAFDDARAAFERAWGLARDPRLKSEAALAAGNTAAERQELDEAVNQYRRAVMADPNNQRALQNLRQVLALKRQQPPPQSGGTKPQDGKQDGKQDEQQDGRQGGKQDDKPGDQDDSTQRRNSEDQKDGDQGGENPQGSKGQGQDSSEKDTQQQGGGGDQERQDPSHKDEGKAASQGADGEQVPKDPAQQGSATKDGDDAPEDKGATATRGPRKQKRDEARRLLDALRARERPLTPLEMRGKQRPQRPAGGKDW